MGSVLDLHVHSRFSLDSPVAPEQYLEALVELRKTHRINGLAFCEHRTFAAHQGLKSLAGKYGLIMLAGVEAETRWGHILLFCPDIDWLGSIDFSRKFEALEFIAELDKRQGIAIPAHPFRGMMSLRDNVRKVPGLHALEAINGGNLPEENFFARLLAEELGLAQVGGSDAHFLNELGRGLTEFEAEIASIDEMIQEIKARRVRPLYLAEAKL